MKRMVFSTVMIWMLLAPTRLQNAHAQDSVFPLPAPLYILTSEQQILRVDPQTGEQSLASPEGQRVLDFDIAPGGEWVAYRSQDNAAVIISEMNSGSGYVAEFLEKAPPIESGRQTIVWSPDASALAYIVLEGVRIAELGAGDYGAPVFSTIQGPWVEFYWVDAETLIASDAAGLTWHISGTSGQWSVVPLEGVAARPQPAVLSYLTADGVMLNNDALIPRTAGARSYDWGPLPLPVVDGLSLPTDLYFLAADADGLTQVWQLPRSGDPVRALTSEADDIRAFAAAPDGSRIAYIVADALYVAGTDGTNRRQVATLQAGDLPPSTAWDQASTQLAFYDGRGVWTVPSDGSQAQLLVINHSLPATQADALNVRFFMAPRWSLDGAQLLVTIGLWEGSVLGVIDVATGALTELPGIMADDALWTSDGRVMAWASAWGYSTPGLFLLNPAQPGAEPVSLLESGTPIVDVYHDIASEKWRWYALVAAAAEIGPQYVWLSSSTQFNGTLDPAVRDTAGGFIREPQLTVPADGAFWAAGLRDMTYNGTGQAVGNLVILNMNTGEMVQVQTMGPVWNVTWG